MLDLCSKAIFFLVNLIIEFWELFNKCKNCVCIINTYVKRNAGLP